MIDSHAPRHRRAGRNHCRHAASLLASAALAAACVFAAAEAQTIRKPVPPPGRDPGGLAIAVLSAGIDYRNPDIARWLARDGEGEVIGWDAVDNDNRPYAAQPSGQLPGETNGTDIVRLIGGPGRRIVPVRIAIDDPASIARALAFVSRTPAAVILMPTGVRIDWTVLVGALAFTAARGLLIVVAADPGSQVNAKGWPILRQIPGVVLVAPAQDRGQRKGPADPDILYVAHGDPSATVASALASCWDQLAPQAGASARKAAFLALVAARTLGRPDGQCVTDTVELQPQQAR